MAQIWNPYTLPQVHILARGPQLGALIWKFPDAQSLNMRSRSMGWSACRYSTPAFLSLCPALCNSGPHPPHSSSSQVHGAKSLWREPHGTLSLLSCIVYLCHSNTEDNWHSRLQVFVCAGMGFMLFPESQRTESMVVGVKCFAMCYCSVQNYSWGHLKKNDIVWILVRWHPEIEQAKSQRQKQEVSVLFPSHFLGALSRIQGRKWGRSLCRLPGCLQGGFTEYGWGPRWLFTVLTCLICQRFGQQPKQLHLHVKSSLVPSLAWLASKLAEKTYSQPSQLQNGQATVPSAIRMKAGSRDRGGGSH